MKLAPGTPLNEEEQEARRAAFRGRSPSRDAQQANVASQRPDRNGLQVGTEYDGVNAKGTRGGVPSDSQIATGETTNVHTLNQQVAVFDKDSGEQQLKAQLEDIWKPVIPEPEGGFVFGYPFVFDPRARYDRNQDRFVLAAVQFQQGIAKDGSVISREDVEERVGEPGEDEKSEGKNETSTAANDSAPRHRRAISSSLSQEQ